MSERREVAAGADAAPAGNNRVYIVVEKIAQPFDHDRPHAGESFGKDVGAHQDQRPDFLLRERVADSRSMAADQVLLKLPQFGCADMNSSQLSKPCGDPVNGALFA